MARPRTIPDGVIHDAILHLLSAHGEKAVAFSSVARATGLAAPTLVQRFGGLDGMMQAALQKWLADLGVRLDEAAADAPLTAKGAAGLLKALSGDDEQIQPGQILPVILRYPALRGLATDLRARIEGQLALRLGGGDKGRERAAMVFAAWQGQQVWSGAGERGFRLRDLIKSIS